MFLDELQMILKLSWDYDTCSPSFKSQYDGSNPSLGQCAVTSLIVNDYLNGKIMRIMTSTGSHYYNVINGAVLDLTKDQFGDEVINYEDGEERTREYILSNEDTRNRYQLLSGRVIDHFADYFAEETTKYKTLVK